MPHNLSYEWINKAIKINLFNSTENKAISRDLQIDGLIKRK